MRDWANKKQLGEKAKAIGELEKQGKVYQGRIENDERSLKNSHVSLESVHEYRKKHAADAALLTDFIAIARGFASIRDMEARHIKSCEALVVAAEKKESAIAATGKIDKDHENSARKLRKVKMN